MTKRASVSQREVDAVTGTGTTGHEWDGIKELDTPLPRWWLWTFYATILWALVYVMLYPAWPLVNSATRGVLGYSTRGELEETMIEAQAAQAGYIDRIAALSLEDISADPDLKRFAVAGGRSAFLVNCVQCHGSGAAGSAGYPNLNDDDWLWGGTLDDIEQTIAHGVRFQPDPDTHISEMPAFGRDKMLTAAEIASAAEFVVSLPGGEYDATLAEEGRTVFAENCAACHGEAGEGDRTLGAPALNDAIALYGGERGSLVRQISAPRHGVMPAWAHRLDPVTIKQLALFVHSLGGGETGPDVTAAK
jgi:cytochrome c oxidase cbb3-type subunit 3